MTKIRICTASDNNYAQYAASLRKPVIIHYIMSDKPWKLSSCAYRRNLYLEEFKKTPWYYEHKMGWLMRSLQRWPALAGRAFQYWSKHPVCFLKPKFWKKMKLLILPLSDIEGK